MADKNAIEKKIDIFVKLVLIFLISLLSFSVGTFVGTNMSESEYRKQALQRAGMSGSSEDLPHFFQNEDSKNDKKMDHMTQKFINAEKQKIQMMKNNMQRIKAQEPQTSKGKTNKKIDQVMMLKRGNRSGKKRDVSSLGSAIAVSHKYILQVASFSSKIRG